MNMFSSETMSRDTNSFNLFQNHAHNNLDLNQQSSRLARYRSAPSSFLAALLDSNTADNSSSGDESEAALFSALMNGPDLNLKDGDGKVRYGMKQEIGGDEAEGQNGYLGYGNNNGSNLVRQSSSPAGFFNGYGVMGEVGNYRVHNNHAEANSPANGFSNHMNFSSGPSSSSRFMPSIPENINESPENGELRNGNNSASGREFDSSFPRDSWNDSPFNGLKRNREGDLKMFSNFNGLENQNGENRKKSHGLVHQMSMPKTTTELAAAEKYLQFQQDVVPCQVRAKRGFATHPRSIAERVRRTRISEKMKKLQDLFPNMDKQTNTADMLDLAVEYIKDLQKQVQTLTDTKAKCVCPSQAQQTRPIT